MPTLKAGTWKADRGKAAVGFTLVELTVVIMLIGIILLVTYPRFEGSFFASNIKLASRRLAAAVRYTQSRAANQRKECRINYDLDHNTYWVSIRGNDGDFVADASPLSRDHKLPEGVIFEDIISPRDGKVQEGQTFTLFLPKGMVDRSQIHLKDETGRRFTLIILPLTAEVRFFDTYVEEEWVPEK